MKNFEHSTKILLANNADPTLKTHLKKATPLHLAVVANATRTVQVLMQHKDLWKEQDLLQQTPLVLGQRFKRDARIVESLQQIGIFPLFSCTCSMAFLLITKDVDRRQRSTV